MSNQHKTVPQPRQVKVSFDSEKDRFWCDGHIFPTLLLNGFTIYVPIIERYMLRQVRPLVHEITDPDLKKRVEAFIIQENVHAREHEHSKQVLDQTGFSYRRIYAILEYFFVKLLEPMARLVAPFFGKYFALATVAGAEHWTSVTADIHLRYKRFLEMDGSPMVWLFAWHAAEEIEHKSVVYDMLQHLNPSYWLRIHAFIWSTLLFMTLNTLVFLTLVFQLKLIELLHPRFYIEIFLYSFVEGKVFQKSVAALFRYLSPNFHPDQENNDHLVDVGLDIARSAGEDKVSIHDFHRTKTDAAA